MGTPLYIYVYIINIYILLFTANDECSWIPLNLVNLLRNNVKNSKLIIEKPSSSNQCEPPTINQKKYLTALY